MGSRRLSDENFEYIYSRVPRLCVELIIKKGNKILLTKRAIEPSIGKWHLPGGGVRFGEGLEEAAKRIAKEELGIDINIIKNLGYIEYDNEIKCGKHSVAIVFLCEKKSGKITLNEEASEFVFTKKLSEDMIPEVKKFLENIISTT